MKYLGIRLSRCTDKAMHIKLPYLYRERRLHASPIGQNKVVSCFVRYETCLRLFRNREMLLRSNRGLLVIIAYQFARIERINNVSDHTHQNMLIRLP